ncbi:MAG: hypothetical protein ACFB13_11950 [Kiloniellaceae bacterium]
MMSPTTAGPAPTATAWEATPRRGKPGTTAAADPDLDLERLVWDPEYRKAMRHLIQPGG